MGDGWRSILGGSTVDKLVSMVGRSIISAQLQVVLVVAGLVLIVIAILGSGDYVKVVIPTLKAWARWLLAALGMAVFSLAFIPGIASSPSNSVRAASTPSASERTKGTNPTDSPTPISGPPSVTIISPPSGTNLPNNTFGASGTARNIPAGDGLWLVIKAPTYYKFYPVGRIKVVNGIWVVAERKICPAGGRQDIRVFLVPNSAAAKLAVYVSRRTSKHDPGIRSMPSSATPEAISRLHVKFNSSSSC